MTALSLIFTTVFTDDMDLGIPRRRSQNHTVVNVDNTSRMIHSLSVNNAPSNRDLRLQYSGISGGFLNLKSKLNVHEDHHLLRGVLKPVAMRLVPPSKLFLSPLPHIPPTFISPEEWQAALTPRISCSVNRLLIHGILHMQMS